MNDTQKQLKEQVNFIAQRYSTSKKLRGITAFWREEDLTACLSYYFDGQFSDEDLEDAYDIGAGTIASLREGYLEEKYIILDYPNPLPEEFLAYKRTE